MYTICFRTIYSSTQVLAIKLRYSEIVLKIFLELNSCIVDSGGGGEILLVLCIITMYFFVFCFFGCICFGHVFRVTQWFSNVLEVEFRTPASAYGGIFWNNIWQLYLLCIVARVSYMLSGFHNPSLIFIHNNYF